MEKKKVIISLAVVAVAIGAYIYYTKKKREATLRTIKQDDSTVGATTATTGTTATGTTATTTTGGMAVNPQIRQGLNIPLAVDSRANLLQKPLEKRTLSVRPDIRAMAVN